MPGNSEVWAIIAVIMAFLLIGLGSMLVARPRGNLIQNVDIFDPPGEQGWANVNPAPGQPQQAWEMKECGHSSGSEASTSHENCSSCSSGSCSSSQRSSGSSTPKTMQAPQPKVCGMRPPGPGRPPLPPKRDATKCEPPQESPPILGDTSTQELSRSSLEFTQNAAVADFITIASQLSEVELKEYINKHVTELLQTIISLPVSDRKQAFRALCMDWHPDNCPDCSNMREISARVFQQLQERKAVTLAAGLPKSPNDFSS